VEEGYDSLKGVTQELRAKKTEKKKTKNNVIDRAKHHHTHILIDASIYIHNYVCMRLEEEGKRHTYTHKPTKGR
jgi:hypothetical protein